MALYSCRTKQNPEKAIQEAISFFGEGGLGLEIIEQSACCVSFEGGGGHVTVTANTQDKETTLELETREWDYHVRQFMRKIA